MSYPNGSVPANMLSPLDGQPEAFLRSDAADSWNRARREIKAATGRDIRARGWNRTLEEQETFFHRAYTPQGSGGKDPRWHRHNGGPSTRYVRKAGHAAAAIPGNSNHGLGIAVDVEDFGTENQWNSAWRAKAFPILAKHGWTDESGRSIGEPWHIEYNKSKDKGIQASIPATKESEDDAMIYRAKGERSPFGVLGHNGGWAELFTKAEYDSLKAAGVKEVWVERQTLDWIIKDSRGSK